MARWKYGARLNSFKTYPDLVTDTGNDGKLTTTQLLERVAIVPGLSSVDFNYPEHFSDGDARTLNQTLRQLGLECNGIAMRFDDQFVRGDFSHPEPSVRKQALKLTRDAASICNEMGGDVLTLWFAHDGYDYSFEGDHLRRYQMAVEGVREVAAQQPDIKISIEYKPYQPRAFTVFADIGMVLLAVRDIGAPNVGVTLDYCHMLMKRENPSQSLAMAVKDGRLYGVHLNDGYRDNDDGMLAGSANLVGLLEFVYYLKKYDYSGLIYFDTFPDRVDPVAECKANIDTVNAASAWVERYGLRKMQEITEESSPLGVHKVILELLNGR